MHKRTATVAFSLAAALAAPFAAAQDQDFRAPVFEQPPGLPPSAVVKRAMDVNPDAKPLGVKLKGRIYVVRLKQDGTIIQVGVDPATGKVFPLQ